jgi:hypothetical protein
VFELRDNAIAPHYARLSAVLKNLDAAHQHSSALGMQHLHQQITAAAQAAGLDHSTIVATPIHVGIAAGPAGDKLADVEFGNLETVPRPILRNAARRAHPAAEEIYRQSMRRILGIS